MIHCQTFFTTFYFIVSSGFEDVSAICHNLELQDTVASLAKSCVGHYSSNLPKAKPRKEDSPRSKRSASYSRASKSHANNPRFARCRWKFIIQMWHPSMLLGIRSWLPVPWLGRFRENFLRLSPFCTPCCYHPKEKGTATDHGK